MGASVGGGGKKGKFDLGQNSEINVTPFVDIMLVLLIIFMVAAPLPTVSIKIEIPPPNPSQTPPDKLPPFINVIGDGKVYIGTVESTLPTLVADLKTALASSNPTEERVMIRADQNIPYKDFMDVLNILQQDGFTKIGLISEPIFDEI